MCRKLAAETMAKVDAKRFNLKFDSSAAPLRSPSAYYKIENPSPYLLFCQIMISSIVTVYVIYSDNLRWNSEGLINKCRYLILFYALAFLEFWQKGCRRTARPTAGKKINVLLFLLPT